MKKGVPSVFSGGTPFFMIIRWSYHQVRFCDELLFTVCLFSAKRLSKTNQNK